MVCRLAKCLRDSCRSRGCKTEKDKDRSIDAVRVAHGNRGVRPAPRRWRRKGRSPLMTSRRFCGGIFAICSLVIMGGSHAPGRPYLDTEAVRPEEMKDYSRLYAQNCSACHGADGSHGAA